MTIILIYVFPCLIFLYIFQLTINQIVECFDPNTDNLPPTLTQFVFFICLLSDQMSVLRRIKRRTNDEMEDDLVQEKIFDMTIQLKGISLCLPENGKLCR